MKRQKREKARDLRINDEIVVDCYGPEEQAMGWYYYLEEKLAFPFKARCTATRTVSPLRKGEQAEVLGMAAETDCLREMLVLIRFAGRKLGVPLAQLEVVKADPETRQAVGDWRYWVAMGYESEEQPAVSAIPFLRTGHERVLDTIRDLHTTILELPSREDFHACGRHLGLLRKKTLVFDNEAEISILSDYQVYSYRPRGFNTAELYLRLNRERLDPLKLALLARMSVALYSVLKIESVEQYGVVHVADLLTGERGVLADNGLSKSGRPGAGFAAHLLKFDNYWSQTGGMVPIDAELLSDPQVTKVFIPLGTGAVAPTDPSARAKLARAIMSAAIRLGYTDRVLYQ